LEPWTIPSITNSAETPAVFNGNGASKTGKRDSCIVGVRIGYTINDFRCLPDSDLYLPQSWADDPECRKETGIPEEVVYRKKTDIALDQIACALANGIRVFAWTFDEWYGRDGVIVPDFAFGRFYPRTFWLY